MTLLTYLYLSSLLLLVRPDYHGLLVAVDDRIESISPVRNSTNVLPGALTVFALSSPTYTEDDSLAFLFATAIGAGKGPSVYRVGGPGVGHTVLHSPQENKTKSVLYFESAAYDAASNTIFLTGNRETRTIFSLSNKPGSRLDTFYTDNQKQPTSITMDVCTRTLYWINSNRRSPSIEVSQLDSGKTWSLVTRDLTKPKAVTFDSYERKLYWAAGGGNELVLSRSNPDGSEREEICRLGGHVAFSLAVSGDQIYWTDWSSFSVWRVEKKSGGDCRPELVRSWPSSKPHGLTFIREETLQCEGAAAPQHIRPEREDLLTTTPPSEETTEARPDPLCANFCLQGRCSAGPGGASCDCSSGWTGERCEVSLCHNFCLLGADCLVIEDQPECLCPPGHHGDRCQLADIVPVMPLRESGETQTQLPLYFLAGLSGLLALVILFLSLTVHNLRLRPRVVRKRFISVAGAGVGARASKEKPTGGCGLPVEDGLQLDIENCCNMTLCETPCFEPPTRGPKKSRKSKSRHGDKASLLDNCDDE